MLKQNMEVHKPETNLYGDISDITYRTSHLRHHISDITVNPGFVTEDDNVILVKPTLMDPVERLSYQHFSLCTTIRLININSEKQIALPERRDSNKARTSEISRMWHRMRHVCIPLWRFHATHIQYHVCLACIILRVSVFLSQCVCDQSVTIWVTCASPCLSLVYCHAWQIDHDSVTLRLLGIGTRFPLLSPP